MPSLLSVYADRDHTGVVTPSGCGADQKNRLPAPAASSLPGAATRTATAALASAAAAAAPGFAAALASAGSGALAPRSCSISSGHITRLLSHMSLLVTCYLDT